jgi:hypothetical protein
MVENKNQANLYQQIQLWKSIEQTNLLSLNIFSYLNESELNNCGQINKKWKIESEHQSVWYQLCQHRQIKIAKINQQSTINWKQIYQKFTDQKQLKNKKYAFTYFHILIGRNIFDYIWNIFF